MPQKLNIISRSTLSGSTNLQSTLHNHHFWHHGDKVPAIKLALGVAILTHRTSFLANNVSTTIACYSVEWLVTLLSASWFVSELSCQRVDFQWVGLSARCLSPVKITLLNTAVDFHQSSHHCTGTSLFCNDHMWQTQPIATSLRALKGQTLAPFSLGWRIPFFCIEIDPYKPWMNRNPHDLHTSAYIELS